MNSIMLTANSDVGRLLLQEPTEVTFAACENQYSGTPPILGFCYLKIVYYCHWFLTATVKKGRGKNMSILCDLTEGIPAILLQGLLAGHLCSGLKMVTRKGK